MQVCMFFVLVQNLHLLLCQLPTNSDVEDIQFSFKVL